MCTVTYLPRPSGYVLTHNRDEAPARSAGAIVRFQTSRGERLLFPRDVKAGGTWFALSETGRSACILNGAFVRHSRQPSYRRSRGLMLLDFFTRESPDEFYREYDFEGIEPFTLLYFSPPKGAPARVVECRWDEHRLHVKELPSDQPLFWCSATLYPPGMQQKREQVFRQWLRRPPTLRGITRLHFTGSVGDPENDFVMNRAGRVQTVSLTQAIVDEKNARMRYFDLLGEKRSERRLHYSERAISMANR